jgi:uncharacterized protein YkwD
MWTQWLPLWLIMGCALLPTVLHGQTVAPAAPDLHTVLARIVSQTNEFRREHGGPEVEVNPQLMATARDFANFMARTGRYGHTADGHQPAERAKQHGYDFCVMAENLAYQASTAGFTTADLAQGFVQGWQHSPDHRQNMLDAAVTETGVAVAQNEQTGDYYAVQLFGRPTSQMLEFQITNQATTVIQYEVDGHMMPLPPQSTRTHQQCRPVEVIFHWPDRSERTTVHPHHSERYVIVQDDSGRLKVREG